MLRGNRNHKVSDCFAWCARCCAQFCKHIFSIFLNNDATIHTSKMIRDVTVVEAKCLPWPLKSPDINIIQPWTWTHPLSLKELGYFLPQE